MSSSAEVAALRDSLIAQLRAASDGERAARDKQYHKSKWEHWGLTVPTLRTLISATLADAAPATALAIAAEFWRSPIFDLRILAPRILARKSIPANEELWRFVTERMSDLDGWAVADTMADVGARCLVVDSKRLDDVERWVECPHLWTRRASLVFTLAWAKGAGDPVRMLAWAARLSTDQEWFIQKAIGWWLRELSKHNPDRTRAFLDGPGTALKGVARREAEKYL